MQGPRGRARRESAKSRTESTRMEDDSVDAALDALWQELNAAEAAVAAFGPTPEQLRAEAAAAERLAKENGTPAKSAAVIK